MLCENSNKTLSVLGLQQIIILCGKPVTGSLMFENRSNGIKLLNCKHQLKDIPTAN